MTSRRKILVVCPTAWDDAALAKPDTARAHEVWWVGRELYDAHPVAALAFDPLRWMDRAAKRFRHVDGVVGTGEYPSCFLAAGIAERLGKPGPPLERIVSLGHKHNARLVHQRAVPEATPGFEPLSPFRPWVRPRMGFPLFVKPVKGTMSIRARGVTSHSELRDAFRMPPAELAGYLAMLRPYQRLLDHVAPGSVPAHWYIAETPLAGEQVTVDGFVQGGKVTIMGVVDSVMYPGTRSFKRFDYPSRLPARVKGRMSEIARRVVECSGLDHACFNVELFHDAATDKITVIEINPRMSYQFSDLYEMVDGLGTYTLQLRIACGEPAGWTPGGGPYGAATSFALRRFTDARVTRAPTAEEIARVAERWPGTTVKVLVAQGERLGAHDQDVGSYRYAIVNLGGRDPEDLDARWAEVERALPWAFAEV